ncbi:MAG: gliding motility-associated C-terminal domain-containing protein, partial [Bacteroidota bacterium]
QINLQVNSCPGLIPVCLPIFQEEFLTYEVFDNGLPYGAGNQGCAVDTTVAYSYAGLLGAGTLGPYLVESWQVNGQTFSGEFADIPALVDSMNIWDPLGKWRESPTQPQSISGGYNDHYYGALVVSKPGVSNSTSVLGINFGFQPKGTEIFLTTGTHELVFSDLTLACRDTLWVNIACLPTTELADTLYAGTSNSLCLDFAGLLGTVQSIREIPLAENTESITLRLNGLDPCVDYTANVGGASTHLVLACDDFGFCDSTYLRFMVKIPEDQLASVQIAPGMTETYCVNTTSLLGTVSTVDSLCGDEDIVRFVYDTDTNCLTYEALDYGSATACYEICDGLGGCLLLELEVNVRDAVTTPVANNDIDTLMGAGPQTLDLVANDQFDTTTDSLEITTQALYGTLTNAGGGRVTYTPNSSACNEDYFTYRLCNDGGCSVAVVQLFRTCDEIRVFSGFSPNGDARNDAFVIQGVEAFPESELQIFNRWGLRIFHQMHYLNDWEGDWEGSNLPDGTYFYLLQLHDGSAREFSGYVQLQR